MTIRETSRVAIIGLGLMGGSLAKALQQYAPKMQVCAFDTNLHVLVQAHAERAIDTMADTVTEAVMGADIIIFAVPPEAIKSVLEEVQAVIDDSQLMMDVTSVKNPVASAVKSIVTQHQSQFILTHPMCGSEHTGYAHARANLYAQASIILTPIDNTSEPFLQRAKAFWQIIGGVTKQLSLDKHDEIISQVSHLPHVISYAYVNALLSVQSAKVVNQFAGTGFKDFTRIAHSNAELWTQICLSNREQLLTDITLFQAQLTQLVQLLEANDAVGLQAAISKIEYSGLR